MIFFSTERRSSNLDNFSTQKDKLKSWGLSTKLPHPPFFIPSLVLREILKISSKDRMEFFSNWIFPKKVCQSPHSLFSIIIQSTDDIYLMMPFLLKRKFFFPLFSLSFWFAQIYNWALMDVNTLLSKYFYCEVYSDHIILIS